MLPRVNECSTGTHGIIFSPQNLRKPLTSRCTASSKCCEENAVSLLSGCSVHTLGVLSIDRPGILTVTGNTQWGKQSFQFPSRVQHVPQPGKYQSCYLITVMKLCANFTLFCAIVILRVNVHRLRFCTVSHN